MSGRRTILIGLCLLLVGSASGGLEAATVGTTGASFLKLNVGARAEAVGGIGVVGLGGAGSLYWNPAGLAADGPGVLAVSHQRLWQDVDATAVAFGYSGLSVGTFALGIERLGVSSWNNLATGPGIDARDLAIILGFGRGLTERTRVGVSARSLSSKIGDHSASGFSFDCGVHHRVFDRLTLGAAVRNLGPGISFSDGDEDPLPLVGSLGGVWRWRRLALMGEVRNERGIDTYGCVGTEVRLHPWLALRAGSRLGCEVEQATSDFTWGAGIGLPSGLAFDYSYRDSDLGTSHQFSGLFPFGGGGDEVGGVGQPGALPSNLAVVKGLFSGAVDSLLALIPATRGREIVIRPRAGGSTEGGRGKGEDIVTDQGLVEDVLSERLTAKGYAVYTGRVPAAEDSAEAEWGDIPVLEYRILELSVDYPCGRRRHYIGRKEIERLMRVHLNLRLLGRDGGGVLWAGAAERAYRDIVPFGLIPALESEGFAFTKAETSAQKWDRVLEPVIATAIVGGLVYLFYSNKSSE